MLLIVTSVFFWYSLLQLSIIWTY